MGIGGSNPQVSRTTPVVQQRRKRRLQATSTADIIRSVQEEKKSSLSKDYCNTKQTDEIKEESSDFAPVRRPRSNTIAEGIIEPTNKKVLPTVFKWDGGGEQVYITGTFNKWKILPMIKSHGDFYVIIDLSEGEYQYKFVVDGDWRHDPTGKTVDDGKGVINNYISVRRSDFTVFQELVKVSKGTASNTITE